MKIHFIGIGGIGISALAQFCKTQGHSISGSEIQETGISEILRKQKIEIKIPQKMSNLPQECDLVIYTEAIGESNPELIEAQRRKIPLKSYFEFLGEISQKFRTIAVAGTHGKTTTTGLLSAGFIKADFEASIFVGSKLKELNNSNFLAGTNDFLLVEACEYRNNFQFLCPEIVILTNVELDHVDFYHDENHYFETFSCFCNKAKVVIFHKEDEKAQKILKNFKGKKIAVSNEKIGDINLSISGIHNRKNAILALKCAEYLNELLDFFKFKKGLENFSGAWRRQEFLGEKFLKNKDLTTQKLLIFDDYGHHPTEIKATLQSFREKFPNQPIGLIFEPHQFSRTKQFFDEFLLAFEAADLIGLFPIYEARDTQKDKESVSLNDFISKNKKISKINNQLEANLFAKKLINQALRKSKITDEKAIPILLFMGAGKIDVFAKKFLNSSL